MIIILKKKAKLIIFALIFIIVSPIVVLYATGDTLTNGWSLLKTGGIYVSSAPVGSEIYLNSKLKETTSFFNRNVLLKSLHPGTYTISVKKEGYNSWTKSVMVYDSIVSDANVFMLPQKPEIKKISAYVFVEISDGVSTSSVKKKNQKYYDVLEAFDSGENKIGTKKDPIVSGKTGIWSENGLIFAGWLGKKETEPEYFCDQFNCKSSIFVYSLGPAITRMDFLPGYENVVIVAFGGDIFAIQIEDNPAKIAQLVYHGSKPDFMVIDGSLYVRDKNEIVEILI